VDFGSPISVDGALTGRGGDIIIIDDPIAAMAALSQKSREHVVNWFFNTALSRLDDKQNGAIVLVMQRLHEDDLAGVLLRGSDKWTVLSLPGIAEQDERIAIGNGQVHVRHAGDALTRNANQGTFWSACARSSVRRPSLPSISSSLWRSAAPRSAAPPSAVMR
jgi:hypothetical protein